MRKFTVNKTNTSISLLGVIFVFSFGIDLRNVEAAVWSVDNNFHTNHTHLITQNATYLNSAIFATPMSTYNGTIYSCYRDFSLDNYVTASTDNGVTWNSTFIEKGDTDDAHNTCSVGIDLDGYIHFSYDHHADPLNYVVSDAPEDISSFSTGTMTNTAENSATYPRFYQDPNGELYFTYRDGGSGHGDLHLRLFDNDTRTWSNFANPLIDGITTDISAYEFTFVWDSEGDIQIFWVWRNTIGQATNEDILYAEYDASEERWEMSDGTPYTLPITASTSEVVDDLSQGSGLANTNSNAVDSQDNPHAVYLKNAPDGKTEVFHAYHNGSEWTITQVTDMNRTWSGVWDLGRPQILIKPDDTIYVFYTTSGQSIQSNFSMPPGDLYWTKSTDYGATWSEPVMSRTPKTGEFNIDYDYLHDTDNFRFYLQENSTTTSSLYMVDGEMIINELEDMATYTNTDEHMADRGTLGLKCEVNRDEVIAFWNFDETSGDAIDKSDNHFNGVLTGSGVLQGESGYRGNSYYFGGSGSVKVGDRTELDFAGSSDFTVQAWLKTSVDQSGKIFISKYGSGTSPGLVIQLNNNHLRAFLRDGSGTGTSEIVSLEGSTDITDGEWHHVAVVYDRGANMSIYVDGELDAAPVSISGVTGSLANNSDWVIGGRDIDTDYYTGHIDEVIVSRGALSPADFNYSNDYSDFCDYSAGSYISPFYTWSSDSRLYDTVTVSAELNGGTVNGIVEGSTDKFDNTEGDYEFTVLDGENTYEIPVPSNGKYSRIRFEITPANETSTPLVHSFEVTSVDLVDGVYFNSSTNATNTIATNGAITWDRPIIRDDTRITSFSLTPSDAPVDVSIMEWNTTGTYYKKWYEFSSDSENETIHVIGDLQPNTEYDVNVDGSVFDTYTSNEDGEIEFTYSGGYSTKLFEVTEHSGGGDEEEEESDQEQNVRQETSGSRRYITGINYAQTLPVSPSQTVVAPVMEFSNDLKINDEGDDVRMLQEFLIQKGYLGLGYNTGFFGVLTRNALIEYQKDNLIYPAVGYFGPITRMTVINDRATTTHTMSTTIFTTSSTTLSTSTTLFHSTLSLGIAHPEVSLLQEKLSENQEIYPEKMVTGYFGQLTQAAVQRFQIKYGVAGAGDPGFGIVGPMTRKKLNEVYSN